MATLEDILRHPNQICALCTLQMLILAKKSSVGLLITECHVALGDCTLF